MSSPAVRPLAQRLLRVLAVVAATFPSVAAAALPARVAPPPYAPAATVFEGWPEAVVPIPFENLPPRGVGCRVSWGRVVTECDVWRHIAEVTVPKEAPPGMVTLKWEVYELHGPTIDRRTAEPPPTETPGPGTVLADGSAEFTVRGVLASADHTEVAAGHTVDVTFRAVGAGVTIGACGVDKPMAAACPEGSLPSKEVRVRVPPEAAPGDLVRLHWNADSGPDDVRHPDEGEIEIRVSQPPPNSEFDVRGQADELGPGQEYVATFRSLTPGVTIAGCGITLGARQACGAAGIAVVRVPSDTPSGTTLSIPWDLKYASRRPGEQHDTTTGTLVLRVRAEASEMKVTVQPATGAGRASHRVAHASHA